jgi:hypothetical protein
LVERPFAFDKLGAERFGGRAHSIKGGLHPSPLIGRELEFRCKRQNVLRVGTVILLPAKQKKRQP